MGSEVTTSVVEPVKIQHSIKIAVSYAWDVDDDGDGVVPHKGARWSRLRGLLSKVTEETIKRAKRMDPDHRVSIRIERLRSRHGANILASLRSRLERADIYIADISDREPEHCNENVMLELGMAIAQGFANTNRMFVLKPKSLTIPSDLSGILFTEYHGENEKWRIVDQNGFRAALRETLLALAVDRALLVPSGVGQVSFDDEIDGSADATHQARSRTSARSRKAASSGASGSATRKATPAQFGT